MPENTSNTDAQAISLNQLLTSADNLSSDLAVSLAVTAGASINGQVYDGQRTLVAETTDIFNWDTWRLTLDNYFAQGQYGILSIKLKQFNIEMPPGWESMATWFKQLIIVQGASIGKDNALASIDGMLTAQGAKLWKPSSYDRNTATLEIHFETALGPAAILAIFVGAAIGVLALAGAAWLVINAISAYQVNQQAAAAYNATKQQTTQAIIDATKNMSANDAYKALMGLFESNASQSAANLNPAPATQEEQTQRWIIVAAAAGIVILGSTAIYMALRKKRR